MARGSKIPADKVVAFRQHYLRTNNAAEAARRCKMPLPTGRGLAQRADADPEFIEARRKFLAQGHEVASLALLESLEIVLGALRAGPLTDSYDSPIDRRAELARAVTGIFDSLDRTKARIEDREEKRREFATAADRPTRIEIVRYRPPVEPATEPPAEPCKSE